MEWENIFFLEWRDGATSKGRIFIGVETMEDGEMRGLATNLQLCKT
jgi:hypothetical protein